VILGMLIAVLVAAILLAGIFHTEHDDATPGAFLIRPPSPAIRLRAPRGMRVEDACAVIAALVTAGTLILAVAEGAL
jgi:hypothetical protein